jgi:hypothetical protein
MPCYDSMKQQVAKEHNKTRRKTWDHPWRYRESFLVVLELLFLGLIFQVLSGGRGAPLLRWPVNMGVGLGLALLIFLIYIRFRGRPVIKWISSVPAAISAISFFALVVLLLGFIPQGDPGANRYFRLLGLTSVKNSWLMMVSGIYFLTTLGFVVMRRATPIRRKNLGFLLNHAGLWITIAAGYLGSGDLERVNLTLAEGHGSVNQAVDQRTQQIRTLPFGVKLIDFNIDLYNPKLAVMDGRDGGLVAAEGKALPVIEDGLKTELADWNVEVLDFEPAAYRSQGTYYRTDSAGSAPAALVRATNRSTGSVKEGWISSGNFLVKHQYMPLDGHHFLVMTRPEPRKFSSEIVIEDGVRAPLVITLEVNKSFKYRGWKLYQLSYDERMGKWSRVSVIEAVRDPWLPVVYTGIFLLLAGALYLFWIGQDIKE